MAATVLECLNDKTSEIQSKKKDKWCTAYCPCVLLYHREKINKM